MHEPDDNQFKMYIGKFIATVEYEMKDDVIYLMHSEVPYHLQRNGFGKSLVEKTFEYIEKHNIAAIAVCPYIRHIKSQNNKWDTLIG